MKRVSFKTVGCRLNQAETATMAARFELSGYEVVPAGSPADVIVIHTCAITGKAERDCISHARAAARTSPRPVIILAGCAVEVSADKLRQQTGADILAGQKDKYRLPELVEKLTGKNPTPASKEKAAIPLHNRTRAIIKIQDGCDFCCAYCVVPKARGAPHSRTLNEIVDEARMLTEKGFKEIILTGANLACYRTDDANLVELLEALENIDDLCRIRLSSVEISTLERAIIDLVSQSKKFCRYLHFPLQSGDDGILAAMGRKYTSSQYRALIEYAVDKIPMLGLGTDIIVGFPGETAKAFSNTIKLVKDIPFSNLHVFSYSPRPGTRAFAINGKVKDGDIKERKSQLIALGEQKKQIFAKRFIGQTVEVLVEKITKNGEGKGWSSEYVEAQIRAPQMTRNRIIQFKPTGINGSILI